MERYSNDSLSGLTLIELLIVMVIIGILATIGFGQYRTSQLKARDAQRKGDLSNISRALEMYYNDNNQYPDSSGGKIEVESGALDWGDAFETSEVIYMKTLPEDPNNDYDYCYWSDGTEYKLYSILENENDSEYYDSYTCNGEAVYNYGVSSSNTSL